ASHGANAAYSDAGVASVAIAATAWSYTSSETISNSGAPTASGNAIHASVRDGSRVSSKPSTSASAGNIGRMYDGSLDPEMLKKANTKAAQTMQKRSQRKPLAATGAARQPLRSVHAHTSSHGRMPRMNHGMK